ncbi:hypothetical protein Aduo_012412 [Ancylostoma duodenale]
MLWTDPTPHDLRVRELFVQPPCSAILCRSTPSTPSYILRLLNKGYPLYTYEKRNRMLAMEVEEVNAPAAQGIATANIALFACRSVGDEGGAPAGVVVIGFTTLDSIYYDHLSSS